MFVKCIPPVYVSGLIDRIIRIIEIAGIDLDKHSLPIHEFIFQN